MSRSPRLASLIGDIEVVCPPNERLIPAMMCMQALALEQMLKSIAIRGGKKRRQTHDLGILYEELKACPNWPQAYNQLQDEYEMWRIVGRAVLHKGGLKGVSIERDLGKLFGRHAKDFLTFRYPEEVVLTEETIAKDRFGMFLAVCAVDAMRTQKMLDDEGHNAWYALAGRRTKKVRMEQAKQASRLLHVWLAEGGHDMRILGTGPW